MIAGGDPNETQLAAALPYTSEDLRAYGDPGATYPNAETVREHFAPGKSLYHQALDDLNNYRFDPNDPERSRRDLGLLYWSIGVYATLDDARHTIPTDIQMRADAEYEARVAKRQAERVGLEAQLEALHVLADSANKE